MTLNANFFTILLYITYNIFVLEVYEQIFKNLLYVDLF